MSALDRGRALAVIRQWWGSQTPTGWVPDQDWLLDELENCVPMGWEAIWQDLNEIYAEDILPTRHVPADDGNGPQVVSLLRLLGRAEAKLARIAALCDHIDGPFASPGSDESADLIAAVRAVLGGAA